MFSFVLQLTHIYIYNDDEPASKQRDVTLSTRCDQLALVRATKRYHTVNSSFQSHPPFIEENNDAFRLKYLKYSVNT